jgi:hypothetical protein
MFKKDFSLLNDVLVLNTIFNRPHCALRLQLLLGLRGKGGSESKTRRPEFLSSQVGNSCWLKGNNSRYPRLLHVGNREGNFLIVDIFCKLEISHEKSS